MSKTTPTDGQVTRLRRLARAERWRVLRGMVDIDGNQATLCDEAPPAPIWCLYDGDLKERPMCPEDFIPALWDPATFGCALALLHETWPDAEIIHFPPAAGQPAAWMVQRIFIDIDDREATIQAEPSTEPWLALLAALEAAWDLEADK